MFQQNFIAKGPKQYTLPWHLTLPSYWFPWKQGRAYTKNTVIFYEMYITHAHIYKINTDSICSKYRSYYFGPYITVFSHWHVLMM